MSTITFAFETGKFLTTTTECGDAQEFFERNQDEDGTVPSWLVLDGSDTAVNMGVVAWIKVEA